MMKPDLKRIFILLHLIVDQPDLFYYDESLDVIHVHGDNNGKYLAGLVQELLREFGIDTEIAKQKDGSLMLRPTLKWRLENAEKKNKKWKITIEEGN